MKELSQSMAEVLTTCLERGMKLPFHVASVGLNGSVLVVRYTEGQSGLDCAVLTQHLEGAYQLPINIMIVDATGEAARLTLSNGGLH